MPRATTIAVAFTAITTACGPAPRAVVPETPILEVQPLRCYTMPGQDLSVCTRIDVPVELKGVAYCVKCRCPDRSDRVGVASDVATDPLHAGDEDVGCYNALGNRCGVWEFLRGAGTTAYEIEYPSCLPGS